MKKLFNASVALVAAAFIAVGCASTSSTSSTPSGIASLLTPANVEAVAQVAASAGANYALSQDTNAGPYLTLGLSVLDTALNNGNLSVTNLQANLKNISTTVLRNPEIVEFLPVALQALGTVEGKQISGGITTNAYVAATVLGIDNGLRQALSMSTIHTPLALTNIIPGL